MLTGKMYLGTIKLPRSKKKRIRNKWLKKQCLGKCTSFKFLEISEFTEKIEVITTPCSITIDELSADNLNILLKGESK